MAASKKLTYGDIFYMVFKKKYIIAKVLFSIDHQYDKKKDKKNKKGSVNYIDDAPRNTVLIEVYNGLHDTQKMEKRILLINRVWVTLDGLSDLEWGIHENEKVNFKHLEFPEVLVMSSEGAKTFALLERGELRFKTNISEEQYEEMELSDTITDISVIPYIALNMMEKGSLIDEDEDYLREESLSNVDLLFNNKLRKKLYDQLKVDSTKSYYELSKELGYDLARFYE